MRIRLTPFIMMLILCTACDRTGSSTPPTTASAEVTPHQVTFTIPVEQRSAWRWNVGSTPRNAFEYDWSISQGVRSFGFSVWKKGDAAPEQGNLSELIKAGQGSIWEPTSEGGGRLVGKIGVTAVRDDSALQMVLSDQSILKELLERRPSTLEVVSRTLDTTKQQYTIVEQRYSIALNYR